MPCRKGIVGAFLTLGKSAETIPLPDGRKGAQSARKHLVRVGLVSHIPDNPVPRGIKNAMESQSQLNNPQPPPKVSPDSRQDPDHLFPDFLGQNRKVPHGKAFDIVRTANVFQNGPH